jgi:membrane protease YdiL (CAAX protease family)
LRGEEVFGYLLNKAANMNIKKVFLFILIAFGISWTSALILHLCDIPYGQGWSMLVVAVFYMMAPAASAVIVQKAIYKQPLKEFGLNFKQTRWKAFLWIPLIQFFFCILYVAIVFVFGNALKIEGFGFYSFDQVLFEERMTEILAATGAPNVPQIPISPLALFGLTIVSSIVIGGLVNGVFTFGEELGWRGFMFNETKHLGFFKSNLLIGTIWGLWHAPIILQGHNYSDHPTAGVFMMIPLSISLSFIMSWMRLKTNSVLAPALFHGMVNASGGGLVILCYEYNDLIGSIAGLAGIMCCLLIVAAILIFDYKTIRNYSREVAISGLGDAHPNQE